MHTGGCRLTAILILGSLSADAYLLSAQEVSAVSTPQVPASGLQNAWDVRKTVADLQKDTLQLRPLLAQLNPQGWADNKGAPTTYIVQWQAAQQQLNDLILVTNLFGQKVESLSLGLDTYFRMESLETTERSLEEGAQHYDSPALAGKLNTMIAHNFASRERLREYLRELATSTEDNFKIADQEAQRCRNSISQQSNQQPVSTRKPRKN